MATKKKMLQAAAGAAGGGELLAIEDVFSTYLYTSTNVDLTITNGINIPEFGGMTWFKPRTDAKLDNHIILDTERADTGSGRPYLITNSTAAQATSETPFYAGSAYDWSSNGFKLGQTDYANGPVQGSNSGGGVNMASWTFRKAPRFFDVVTASIPDPEPSTFTVNHNLGTTVGMVIVKSTTHTYPWLVFHRSLPSNYNLELNTTAGQSFFGGTNWSSTDTTVTLPGWAGQSGGDVVIYLFAHDPLGPSGDGSDGLIACGSFAGGTIGQYETVSLGWEPQWLLLKRADGAGSWFILDNMRGIVTGGDDKYLLPHLNIAEGPQDVAEVTSTGFRFLNATSPPASYIYIAIRRGPMRAPESGTEVFDVVSQTPDPNLTGTKITSQAGVVDAVITTQRTHSGLPSTAVVDRMRGGNILLATNSTAADNIRPTYFWYLDHNDGLIDNYAYPSGTVTTDMIYWMFSRAPGFFDVVAYTGNSVAGRTVPHNLGVAPELMIVKSRSNLSYWQIYHSALGATKYIEFGTNGASTNSARWNDTTPTASDFILGNDDSVNISGRTYIAYLFATLPGVSKVGSYTGTGGTNTQVIDCGFTAGARFVLLKRYNANGYNWQVFDTARGITVGNDAMLALNTTAAESVLNWGINPNSAGFEVTGNGLNETGGEWIFYAIA